MTAHWLADAWAALRPPPKLTLSEWADKHFRLTGATADEGNWHTRPYQRGIMDAITDPDVERVSVIKSARVGWTQIMNAAIAYFMTQDPCPIMVVQPTVETAQIYSREMIAPMMRGVPALAAIMGSAALKTSGRTLLHKTYPGGVFSTVGANSGAGFAMVSRRVVAFDEVDRYPASAGDEGDPIALGEKRASTYWNRKLIAGSTPKIAGASRIERMFEAGDRRRFYVPCPLCGHMDFLRFRRRDGDDESRGHRMKWDDGLPETARFVCSSCSGDIDERHKEAMLEAGEWRADSPFDGHASFHIWAAYSLSPNATWSQIVAEFLDAKNDAPALQAFINTTIGETWQEHGESPPWEALYKRREPYRIGTVPEGVIALTCGTDVQKDRIYWEVIGWDPDKRSCSIEIGIFWGDTSLDAGPLSPWLKFDELLEREFPGADGARFKIQMAAIDSGYNTNAVYNYCRRHPPNRVIAVKGVPGARALIGMPSKVDITVSGRRMQRGFQMYPVGGAIAKTELYGHLGLVAAADGTIPPGYCRFPEYDEEFFKQLTAEHLVKVVNRRTRVATMEWRELPNRENHHLDCRVYGRAAAALLGLDRLAAAAAAARETTTTTTAPPPAPPRQSLTGERKGSAWGRGSIWDRGGRGRPR